MQISLACKRFLWHALSLEQHIGTIMTTDQAYVNALATEFQLRALLDAIRRQWRMV